jgi:AraC family transcriptional regulator
MDVKIVTFPETKVAAIEHRGSPSREHETAHKLIAWKLANRLLDPSRHRSYGVHYTDPLSTPAAEHRVDFCLSVEEDVAPNPYGIVGKLIPGGRCALARHVGSRAHNAAAVCLYAEWFPQSGESLRDFPIFFHYVNVGANVREEDMITDVYLPLK